MRDLGAVNVDKLSSLMRHRDVKIAWRLMPVTLMVVMMITTLMMIMMMMMLKIVVLLPRSFFEQTLGCHYCMEISLFQLYFLVVTIIV